MHPPPSMYSDAAVARMLRSARAKRGLPPYSKAGEHWDPPARKDLTEAQEAHLREFIRAQVEANPEISNPKIRKAFNNLTGLQVGIEMVRYRRTSMGLPSAPRRQR